MNTHRLQLAVGAALGIAAASVAVGGLIWVATPHQIDRAPDDSAGSAEVVTSVPASEPAGPSEAVPAAKARPERTAAAATRAAPRPSAAPEVTQPDEVPDAEAGADELDIAMARQQELEAWSNLQVEYEREPVDRQWSVDAGEKFLTDMLAIAEENGLDVVDADCRTTRCKAVVQWPSFDQAVAGFTTLLHHQYQVTCARETLLPEPAEQEAGLPYQVTVLFDCSGARYGG